MTRTIGAAEFKAKCLRILEEVRDTGEGVTITKRGRPVAVLSPPPPAEPAPRPSLFGAMKGTVTWLSDDHTSPAVDWEAEWERNNPPGLYDR